MYKIILHFFGKTSNYIVSKPIHGSQISKWISDDLLEVKIEIIPNIEFEMLVLSFGHNIKVVSPKSISNHIRNKIKCALENY